MATQSEIIGEEWFERAPELADWAMTHLVNRKDVWGQYSVLTPSERRRLGRSYKAMTLPRPEMRGEDMVTLDKLTRHFASRPMRKPQLIGLHAKSQDSTSRWFGIDIDMHDEAKTDAEDHARRNLQAALQWWRQLQQRGYDPMLFDSNSYGGYHLWVLFAEPAPTDDVYAMVKGIAESWREAGLSEEPETFPKRVRDDSLGAWFRLPGMHHSRAHYSALWSGDEWLDDPWLTGHAAIDAMLANVPGPPPPAVSQADAREKRARVTLRSPAAEQQPEPEAAPRQRSFARTRKPRVCVDLDGVLLQRAKGSRKTTLGKPFDGAAEFMQSLAARADIMIYTARFTGMAAEERETLAKRIGAWLDKHHMPFQAIYLDAGKPLAVAFIDDRGVSCRPADDGLTAFDTALAQLERLL